MVCVNKCCYCCELRTGGIVVALLGLLSAILLIASGSITLNLSIWSEFPDVAPREAFEALILSIIGSQALLLLTNFLLLWGSCKVYRHLNIRFWSKVSGLSISVIGCRERIFHVVVSHCLSHKSSRCLLLPWLITEALVLFPAIIATIVLGGLTMIISTLVGVLIYVLLLPTLGILLYLWICILSLYQKLKLDEHIVHPQDQVVIIGQSVADSNNTINQDIDYAIHPYAKYDPNYLSLEHIQRMSYPEDNNWRSRYGQYDNDDRQYSQDRSGNQNFQSQPMALPRVNKIMSDSFQNNPAFSNRNDYNKPYVQNNNKNTSHNNGQTNMQTRRNDNYPPNLQNNANSSRNNPYPPYNRSQSNNSNHSSGYLGNRVGAQKSQPSHLYS